MIVAVYSAKGGVGKSTLAVNLAWASAALSKRRTLLWDLDAQGAASYILGQEPATRSARASITRDADVSGLIRPSNVAGLAVLPADESLRTLDYAFHDLGKRRRLAKIAAHLEGDYDRIIIDCPPGLTDTLDGTQPIDDAAVVVDRELELGGIHVRRIEAQFHGAHFFDQQILASHQAGPHRNARIVAIEKQLPGVP